jgi:hypothetical protein
MTLTRLASLTLLLALGFAVLPPNSLAQDKEPPLPVRSGTAFTRVKDMQEKGRIDPGDVKQAAEHMKSFAQYFADFVAHPLVYRFVQDPSTKLPRDIYPPDFNIDKQMAEMSRYLMEPHPRNRSADGGMRVNRDHQDYIRELGKALDDAFMKLVKDNPTRIVKVNAMRMYATACKTGAPAHWPTVTNLLTDPKTRPEIRVFALQAAANLLSAYDPDFYQSRRHSIGSKTPRDAADKEIGALVKAVQDCVTTPKLLVPDWPDGKDKDVQPTENQVEVLKYLRREAIRALGQVRFASLPGPQGKAQFIHPAHTLARVCVLDPILGPAPTPSECAEAVIGLCNMAPVWEGAPLKNYNADAVALAVAKGVVNFASPRTDPDNRELAWTGYALRMSEAMREWPPIFSFLFDPTKPPNPNDAAAAPAVVNDVITRAHNAVLIPLFAKGGRINLTDLDAFIKNQEAKPNVGIVFTDVPGTALPGYQKK